MTKAEIAIWLGRPLTATEDTNFTSYLNTAKEYVNSLLCVDSLASTTEERIFDARNGYSTVFTGYFEGVPAVSINGVTQEVTPKFWDNRNSSFYNSVVFKDTLDSEEVTITASWGFATLPSDLGQLYAQLFSVASNPYTPSGDIKSKRVEDFSITFGDRDDTQVVIDANRLTIEKYALCSIGNIQHGAVDNDYSI